MTLVFLLSFVEVIDVIMQGAGRESRLVRLYTEATVAAVSLLPPADVALRTCFLWTDVGEELFVSRLLIASDTL